MTPRCAVLKTISLDFGFSAQDHFSRQARKPSNKTHQQTNIMKIAKTLFSSFGLLVSTGAAFCSILDGPVYNPLTGHNYYLLDTTSWTASESQAIALGGHLVTVNDAAENTFLVSTFSNFGGVTRALWTGLNDAAHEGTFVWSSGDPSLYRNWERGQPDNGGGFYPNLNYVNIWPSPGPRSPGQWDDHDNSNTFPDLPFNIYGVVEVVPEPTSMGLFALGLGIVVALRRQKLQRNR